MPIPNLFDAVTAQLPEELTDTLLSRDNVRIERIVSQGHASPDGFWYDQDEHEWVAVLQGSAGVVFEGNEREQVLRRGDVLLIPARQRHRVAWTDAATQTIWLAVFFADKRQG